MLLEEENHTHQKETQKAYVDNNKNAYVNFREPSKDWNPLNATDEELQFYGYPSRPKNKNDLEQWKKIVSCKWVKPEMRDTGHKKINQ